MRWVLRSGTDFSSFLHIYLREPLSAEESTALPFWPIPAPYPELLRADAALSDSSKIMLCRKMRAARKAVNLIVLVLSWLRLGSPRRPPAGFRLGLRCRPSQWQVVRRLESFLEDVRDCGVVGPAEMGRSAAKVEGLDVVLSRLHASTEGLVPEAYAKSCAAGGPVESTSKLQLGSDTLDCGVVVGKLKSGTPVLAKEIEPNRLSLPTERPMFDPTPFLEEPHLSVYKDPVACATAPALATEQPPRVRVHTKKGDKMNFLKFLDRHHRLALAADRDVRSAHLCGAFSLVKDSHKDRLILDARAPNQLEETLQTWCSTLGSSQALTLLEPREGAVMRFSGTDLRDYYHCFKVSRARSLRNALALPLSPQHASQLGCFDDKLWHCQNVYPCLTSLAMGDNQAVEIGQKVHIKLGLAARAFSPFELLTVHGRAPGAMSQLALLLTTCSLPSKCLLRSWRKSPRRC